LVLVSVGTDDDERDVRSMAEKVAELRIFPDANGLMNRSLQDADGALLLVSQFTLHGDVRRGRRPSFMGAAPPARARNLYELLGRALASLGLHVAYGEFGAHMAVELVNDGPVTILVDTKRLF
jgi:D-tyrosyl-tRNA(Tyr) deacylase